VINRKLWIVVDIFQRMYSYLSFVNTRLSNMHVTAPFVASRTTLSPSAFYSSHRSRENNENVTQERNRKRHMWILL